MVYSVVAKHKKGHIRCPFFIFSFARHEAQRPRNPDATGEPRPRLLTSQQMARSKPKKKVKIAAQERPPAKSDLAAMRPPGELVIITGMSGSGKASVLKAFEDLGYYCVDNLPVELIPRFAELVGQSSEISRTALVVDVREGTQLEALPAIVKSVKRMLPTKVIFLEADESILLRRFSETRRPHPLGTDSPVKASLIAERRHLRSIRAMADLVIDTSRFNVHELRAHITDRFHKHESDKNILVSCVSFGFKHGVPHDADLLFDVRFLPNPHFVPEFRPLTGRDPKVARYIRSFPQSQGIHPAHLGAAGLSLAALHPGREKLSDHRLRLYRRPAPLRHDRGRRRKTPAQGRDTG